MAGYVSILRAAEVDVSVFGPNDGWLETEACTGLNLADI
jgi:hypothetical protein